MDVRVVQEAARQGHAIKAPNYHAGRRGVSFLQILEALERCYHVAPDDRPGVAGHAAHPNGWFALANLPNRRRLRVDFDVLQDQDGTLLLVVTAYDT
ncbi:MAG: hypothetical protein AABY18_02740 [Candidatus Thermoplasmatota archaeon]